MIPRYAKKTFIVIGWDLEVIKGLIIWVAYKREGGVVKTL